MTILPWPTNRAPRRPKAARKLIVDPLPQSVLHALVADMPGPKNETEQQRAVRFDAQLAELLRHNPRNAAEAMIASHCNLLGGLAKDWHQEANSPDLTPAARKRSRREATQMDRSMAETKLALTQRQKETLREIDPTTFIALGLTEFLIPDPDDPDQAEEPFSAIIVPLHPAPKMLQ